MFSNLLIQTDSDKEITLINTAKILCRKEVCTTNSKYIYIVSDTIKKYRTHPFSFVSEIDTKLKIDKILLFKNDVICTGDGYLIKNFKETVSLDGDVLELLSMDDNIGVQYKEKLVVYDSNLKRLIEYKCTSSYYLEGIILLGYKNHLQIITKSSLDIYLEDNISCITCDVLFTKIFCGTVSGNIYQINMDGSPNKLLAYHESSVKFLRMSVCNRFLYSTDESGNILIWEDIVLDRLNIENIKGIEVYL